MAEDVFDLSDTKEEQVEQGGVLPVGWYLADVSNVEEDNLTHALELTFEVVAGPHRGGLVRETLWHPGGAKDDKGAKVSMNRRILFAKRLGLIQPSDFGKAGVKVQWTAAVGTRCFINVDHREYEKKDKSGRPTGQKGVATQLKFDGIFPVGDDRVPQEARGAAEGGGPVGSVAGRSTTDDFGDL